MNIKRTMVWMVQKPIVFGLVTSSMLVASGIAWSYWTSSTDATSVASGTAGTSPAVVITGAVNSVANGAAGDLFVPGKAVAYTLQAKSATDLGTGAKFRLSTIRLTGAKSNNETCNAELGMTTVDGGGVHTDYTEAINGTKGFAMSDVVVNASYTADGTNQTISPNAGTISLFNATTSQDTCKGKTFTFYFSNV